MKDKDYREENLRGKSHKFINSLPIFILKFLLGVKPRPLPLILVVACKIYFSLTTVPLTVVM